MKQVIVVNQALDLPKGKLAAQVAHASVASLLTAGPEKVNPWLQVGMPKIVVKAADDSVLQKLEEKARAENVPAQLIRDAGKTVVAEGTMTCLGVGPDTAERVDLITGDLSLL